MKPILIIVFFVAGLTFINAWFFEPNPVPNSPSIWIETWLPNGVRRGHNYNNCTKLNDSQYLFVGKDYLGNTFDSSIITINR